MEFENAYQESRGNFGKNKIAETILNDIQSRNPPGRFLELSHANGQEIWLVMMDHGTVIKKIKQALRDVKKGSSSLKNSTNTSPPASPTSISSPRPTCATVQSEEAVNYPEQVSQDHRRYENNDDSEWSPPRSLFAASMPPLSSTTPLVAQELIATRAFSSTSNLLPTQNVQNYTKYHDTNHQSLVVEPHNIRSYFTHGYTPSRMSSITGGATGADIDVSTGSGTELGRDSLNSLQSADVELLRASLESVEMRDSIKSHDMEVISEALFDEQK